MQSVPRFSVVDNHRRAIPELKPIGALAKEPPSASGQSVEKMQSDETEQPAKAPRGVSDQSDMMEA